MQILFFGTFDEQAHPRVRVLREGLADRGLSVAVCNVPLGLTTEARIQMTRRPVLAISFLVHLATCWIRLLWAARGLRPDVVLVGYLGHFDVHLARLRFRRATIVLDHMVSLGDTARDREVGVRSRMDRVLDAVDRSAIRAADILVVDTDEQRAALPGRPRRTTAVVDVGAPKAWSSARSAHSPSDHLRIVFFGLYTPLQGAIVIGEALRALGDERLTCTMIGDGQDREAVASVVGKDPRIKWIDWMDETELAPQVAAHDVCLGIFGDSPKALRVVPNKVYQGAAAGCAIVTSDTPPQRRALGDCAVFVRPGDASSLAHVLRSLVTNPAEVERLRTAAARHADHCFTPSSVVAPLLAHLGAP